MNRVPIPLYAWFEHTSRRALRYLLAPPPVQKHRKMTSLQHRLRDPNTLSNYNEFVTTHTVANLNIDFKKKTLAGNILLKLKPIAQTKSQKVVLDSSYLDIQEVKVDGHSLKWDLLPRSEPYGSALKIDLDKTVSESASVEIDVSSTYFFTNNQIANSHFWSRSEYRPHRNALLYNGSRQLKLLIKSIHFYVSEPLCIISKLANLAAQSPNVKRFTLDQSFHVKTRLM